MSIPEFSVKRQVTITMLVGIILVLGFYSFTNLGLDLLPDISYPTVSVITTWSGAAPEDVEKQVTKPLEQMFALVSNVKNIKSSSREGLSVITIEFEWGTNIDFAAQDLRDQISIFKDYLPQDVDEPIVFKFDVSMMPIAAYAISGDVSEEKLKNIAEDVIKPKLERIDGVASVMLFGTYNKEVQILLDPKKINALGIDPQQIQMALMFNNINMPAGHIVKRNKEYLLRTYGEFKSIKEISNIIVGMTKDYKPIYLRDIAKVQFGYKERRTASFIRGKQAIWIMLSKESGANTVNVMKKVLKEQKEIEKLIPKDVKLDLMFDMSDMIKRVTNKTANNGLVGAILAIIFIFLFLRSWRPTLAISLAIPLSIIATFIAIYAAGYTLNLMTMVGLMLGVGMLVDNSVVVIENIFRLIESGENRIVAASKGATQVGMAITASTLTTIAVFFPVLFIPGIVGQLSRGLALTVSFSLLASLFVALTIVPVVAANLFKKEKNTGVEATKWFKKFRALYEKALRWVLNHKKITVLATILIFAISLGLYPIIGGEFMPKTDQSFAQIFFSLPQGTTIDETIALGKELSSVLDGHPNVEMGGMMIGAETQDKGSMGTSSTSPTNVNEGTIFIKFKRREERPVKMSTDQMIDMIRQKFPKLKNSKFIVLDMSSQMNGGEQGDIEVKIYGDNLEKLNQLSRMVTDTMKNMEGLTDVDISIRPGSPEMRIIVDKDKCARLGLTAAQVGNAIKTYTLGTFAGRYTDNDKQIDITIKLPKKYRDSMSKILTLPIITKTGASVPLSQVAHIADTVGPTEIQREGQKRKISITATVAKGYNLQKVAARLKKKLNEIYNSALWETGYTYDIGGQYSQMKDLFKWMLIAALVALLLVYMVMASQFESFLHPFVIMFTQPLAIIGVFWALLITGKTFSLPSLLGFIILIGIVVNNGIVLVDFINQLRREGMSKHEAIVKAGTIRLRPVLITALTTIFGMLPMAFSRSQGSEMRSSLAIAIIGGLTTATFLTLLVIPVIYSIFERASVKAKRTAKKLLGLEPNE